jgi:hypothetical protein
MSDFIIVGEEAWLPDEWERRQERNRRRRERYASDPVYREREQDGYRRWREANAEHVRVYNREWMRRKRAAEYAARPPRPEPVYVSRASLHGLRCTGPTYRTGCRCRKVILYERVA